MKALRWMVAAGMLAGATGCTVTRMRVTPEGWELRRVSFLQRVEMPQVNIGSNGTATLQGYRNDGGADAAAKITAAAVKSAMGVQR